MVLISTTHVDKPFYLPVVDMENTDQQDIDLANICGLVSFTFLIMTLTTKRYFTTCVTGS